MKLDLYLVYRQGIHAQLTCHTFGEYSWVSPKYQEY